RVAETLPDFPFRLRLSRVLTACGIAMLLHYLVSGVVFYAFEFRGGAGRYFDGHRVLPAFALYVLLSLAGVYTGLVFLAARDHLSAVERVSLRRFAFCCIGFAPPMLAVDELRFLIPPLWNLYPREDLFVLPFFFAATSLAALGYAKSHTCRSASAVGGATGTPPFEPIELSQREREVAELLSRGLAYKEVSYRLGISMGTTQSHVAGVYRKLGVNCKEDLMLLYSRSQAPDTKQ
ncbi:MAG: helix-turn-helix transcriptional regulator, partial [Treponemataceae bacterium]